MKTTFSILMAIATFATVGCSSPASKMAQDTPLPPLSLPTTLEEAIASGYRSPVNRERDQYRHPLETLKFFGIQPEMTVIEISPGAGWYAEILAPYLAPKGHYVAAAVPVTVYEGGQAFIDWMKNHPEVTKNAKVVDFVPPKALALAEPGTADMVLTFRNVHNWMKAGSQDAVFKSFFSALKPGGVLGVVEHRQKPGVKDAKASSGYVGEDEVIRMAKKAGFELVAKSEVNANPKDMKNHPKGVWTLPPTYALGDQDREKYKAIGESDRMTLKFIKPFNKKK